MDTNTVTPPPPGFVPIEQVTSGVKQPAPPPGFVPVESLTSSGNEQVKSQYGAVRPQVPNDAPKGKPLLGFLPRNPSEVWQLLNTTVSPGGPAAPPKEAIEEAQHGTVLQKRAMGVRIAADDFLTQIATPIGVGTVGLSALPKLGALVSAAFAATMVKPLAADIPKELGAELGKNKSEQDQMKEAQLVTSEALGVPTLAGIGEGIVRSVIPQSAPKVLEVGRIAPERVAEIKQHHELALSLEHKSMVDAEAAAHGDQVVYEAPADSNEQFAKQIAAADRKRGVIRINLKVLTAWLAKNVPKGKETDAIRSLLSEERIHLATSDEAALEYHNSLTLAEQLIGQRVYGGPNAEAPLSPLQLGLEMLRMRMQQLARMNVRETLERSTKERWKVKSLLAVNDAIQGIRETLGTQASNEGKAILGKVQENLNAALTAQGVEQPGASRKEERERDIAEYSRINEKAKSLPGGWDNPRFMELWQAKENIKGKYKGYVPGTEPMEPEQPGARRKDLGEKDDGFLLPPVPGENVERPEYKQLPETSKEQREAVQVKVEQLKQAQQLNVKDATKQPSNPPRSPLEKRLGLDKPITVGEAIRNITSNKETFSPDHVELARFLDDKFSHVLDSAGLQRGLQPGVSRPSYSFKPGEHTVYLGLDSPSGGDVIPTLLHEAGHAATFWAIEHPVNEGQRAAGVELNRLRGLVIKALPIKVREFFEQTFNPVNLKNPNISYEQFQNHYEAANLNIEKWHEVLYALQDRAEFVANVFNSEPFRKFLDGVRVENNESVFRRVYTTIIKALGISPGTALEKTFDQIIKLSEGDAGAYYKWTEESTKMAPQLPSDKRKALPAEDIIWVAEHVLGDQRDVKAKFTDWTKQKLNQVAGFSAPKTTAVSKDAGNAMIRYASSRVAGPLIGKAVASAVLGEKWNDPKGFEKAGAVLVEMNLQSTRDRFLESGDKEKADAVKHVWQQDDSPIKSKAEYETALKDSDVVTTLSRFGKLVSKPSTELQKQLKGPVLKSDNPFANLIALQDAEGEDITKYAMSGKATQGDLSNPLRRGSAFTKERRGTAKQYSFNIREMIENTITRNYEEKTKYEMYDAYLKAGLAKREATEGYGKITVSRGRGKHEDLFFRHDISPELRQALQTDSPVSRGVSQFIIGSLTDVQLAGPIDVTVHICNMFSAIAGSQGGETLMVDLLRKIPGIRELDAMVRLSAAAKDVIVNSPEVQQELAEIAKIGAGRGAVTYPGMLGKLLPTGKLVHLLDKSSRLAMSRMYDNLVERGWAADTEQGRREYINKMGQYQKRLMSRFEQLLKETSGSPFIVAGKNFNRLALQRLMLNPGVEAANRGAAIKMRLVEVAGLASTLMAIPLVINYFTTGSIWGSPGAKPGAIDTGKKDEKGRPIQIDLIQNVLVRRGLRISGAEAAVKDMKEGLAEHEIIMDAFKDMARGFAAPYEGPGVKFGWEVITGKDNVVYGYNQSDNPNDLGANLAAAIHQMNPSFAKYFQARQEGESQGKSITKGLTQPLLQISGVTQGRHPSLFEQEKAIPGFEKKSLTERAGIQQGLINSDKSIRPFPQELQQSMEETERSKVRQHELGLALKPETQQWLASQKLEVPGFAEALKQVGVSVYLLPDERKKLKEVMATRYEQQLTLWKTRIEAAKTPEQKKRFFNAAMRVAHNFARHDMREIIGNGSEP